MAYIVFLLFFYKDGMEFGELSESAPNCVTNLKVISRRKSLILKLIGAFYYAHVGKSILWVVISCWSMSGCVFVYIPTSV